MHGVNFDLKRGHMLGVVGESGSGKTTMGLTLLRLHEPTSGEGVFNGRDLLKLSGAERWAPANRDRALPDARPRRVDPRRGGVGARRLGASAGAKPVARSCRSNSGWHACSSATGNQRGLARGAAMLMQRPHIHHRFS